MKIRDSTHKALLPPGYEAYAKQSLPRLVGVKVEGGDCAQNNLHSPLINSLTFLVILPLLFHHLVNSYLTC